MKYAIKMGSSAIMYIPSFIKIGSAIQNLIGDGDKWTHRQHGDRISLFFFFKIRKARHMRADGHVLLYVSLVALTFLRLRTQYLAAKAIPMVKGTTPNADMT
jgi:hypothetical protein